MQYARLFPRTDDPITFDSYDYRAICLFCACLIYGLFGSPTPDALGWVEIYVGILLTLSVGVGRLRDVVFQPNKQRFWKGAGQVYLLYGLSIPFCVGVISGHDVGQMMRDIIPFLFLFMPLFFLPVIRAKPHYFRTTLVGIVLIGLLFSLRSLVMQVGGTCKLLCSDELLYLENMPTVLFSCLLLIGGAMRCAMRGLSVKNIFVFFSFIALSLLPIAAMALSLQRASLGAVLIYGVIMMIGFGAASPKRFVGLFVLGALVLSIVNISFAALFDPLLDKTQKVGLNMRPEEFSAVWQVITAHPLTFFFGLGWGGMFESPAVGGLSVNFTHNFFTSVLLKTGVVGIVFCVAYIIALLERLWRVTLKNMVIGFALAAPILIDLTLYASFKSLDFGLVLLMISGALVYLRQSEYSEA